MWGAAWLFFVVFTIATLGLALLTDAVTDHLTIDSFGWALGGAFMMGGIGDAGGMAAPRPLLKRPRVSG